MTHATLASLFENNKGLREVARSLVRGSRGSATILLVLLAVIVMVATAYYVWRWQRRLAREPGAGSLLKQGARQMGLKPAHCRLLRRLAHAAGIEPMAALVSPQLLTLMVQKGKQAGVKLSKEERRELGHILEVVSTAADSDHPAGGRPQEIADSTDSMR